MRFPRASYRRVLWSMGAALLFTLLLNAGSIAQLSQGRLTTAYLDNHDIDERYYFATIAKVGMGEPALGHASYMEHRTDAPSVTLAPIIEGLIMRWLHLSLPATLFLGDILFPFAAVFLLTIGCIALLEGSSFLAACTALVAASSVGIDWLRSSNPQIPLLGAAAWFAALFLLPADTIAAFLVRGLLVGALMWVQLVYASFFVIADGTLLLASFSRHRSPRRFLLQCITYAVGFGIFLVPRVFVALPRDVATDTFHRIGMIPTHLPAAPGTQLVLAGALVVLLALRVWKRAWPSDGMRTVFFLLLASLLALNQSVIHGIDATFVSYYQYQIKIILFLAVAATLLALVRQRMVRRVLFACWVIFSLVAFSMATTRDAAAALAAAIKYENSDAPAVLSWLRGQPGPVVVAAPGALNERIPYETQDYVLFNEYGWNQPSTDRELAQRYALQVRLIPSSKAKDRTYTFVFGGYGGLLAAKERSFCRIKRTLLHTSDSCDIQARSLIVHQDLLPIVDNASVRIPDAMTTYHVSLIISAAGQDTSGIPRDRCHEIVTIGIYTVWSCYNSPAGTSPHTS